MHDTRYYSLRRLSPYLGTVQVIETSGMRALSPDGITWQVQIAHSDGSASRRLRNSVFGTWRADGSGDLIETERTSRFVAVLRDHPRLPFVLADRMELWLLDADTHAPLALLAASLPLRQPSRRVVTRWIAVSVQSGGFVSPSLAVQQAAGLAPEGGVSHGELLAHVVREAAGAPARAQWFLRDEAGGGEGLAGINLGAGLEGRRLSPTAFPELIVREHWTNEMHADLVRDYHAWLAPYLLTHPDLDRDTRERLEMAACRQADKLYRLRYLLPEAVNPERLKVALVEAVLRGATAPAAETA